MVCRFGPTKSVDHYTVPARVPQWLLPALSTAPVSIGAWMPFPGMSCEVPCLLNASQRSEAIVGVGVLPSAAGPLVGVGVLPSAVLCQVPWVDVGRARARARVAGCQGGSFALESVAAFAWKGSQASSGISGWLGPEYALDMAGGLSSWHRGQTVFGDQPPGSWSQSRFLLADHRSTPARAAFWLTAE